MLPLHKSGSKAQRTQPMHIRLTPRVRYLAELAARQQSRTVSGWSQWAIERALEHSMIGNLSQDSAMQRLDDVADQLWDVDEADRFVKLAMRFPSLLNFHEQRVWKIICEMDELWDNLEDIPLGLSFTELREQWQHIIEVSNR